MGGGAVSSYSEALKKSNHDCLIFQVSCRIVVCRIPPPCGSHGDLLWSTAMGNQTLALQRKDLDAAHAAAHGIRIPQMFATFEKARDFVLKKNGKLILRTEHPLEREGLSGLNMSHRVSLEDVVRH